MNDTTQDRRQATIHAAPPPVLTRAERLRIYHKIKAHWHAADDCYAGSWTDMAIGEAMKAPRICVTEIREQFFGDHDTNQEDLAVAKASAEPLSDSAMAHVEAYAQQPLEMAAEADATANVPQAQRAKEGA